MAEAAPTDDNDNDNDEPAPPPSSRRFPLAAIVVVTTLTAGLLAAYWWSVVIGPLLLALALAYILEPIVQWLRQKGMSRPVAVTLVVVVGLAAGLSLAGWLAVETVDMVAALASDGSVGRGIRRILEWSGSVAGHEDAPRVLKDLQELLASEEFWQKGIDPILGFLQAGLRGLGSLFNLLGVLLLMPIYLFYLMLSLDDIWAWVRRHLPARGRDDTLRVLRRLHEGMAAFLRGRVVLAGFKGALLAAGLGICGTTMFLVVGLGAGILSILPFIGPALGYAIALALTIADGGSLGIVLGVTAVFVVGEAIEGFVLTPMVMRKGADLHPLTILFCVVFWGTVFGVFGALVAIPLTLALKVLLDEYVMPSVRELAEI